MITPDQRAAVDEFLAGISKGDIPAAILTEDFQAWTGSSGDIPGDRYLGAVRRLATLFKAPLAFTVLGITAEGRRVAVEVTSRGELVTGEVYANAYHFLFEFTDDGIREVREYMNTRLVAEVLAPLMAKAG